MAEKYGEVPKKFTKAWWEYFWMYYKWHVLITALVVIVTSVTIAQCVTREKYDLHITYMGGGTFSQEVIDRAEEICNKYATDADGNGEVNVLLQQLMISGTSANAEMNYAAQTKHDMELSTDGSYIFIYDESESANQLGREHASETYLSVDEWAAEPIADDRLVLADDGTPLGVRLTSSCVLSESGMKTDGLILCVKTNFKGDEFNTLSQQCAIEVANEFIK